MVLCGEILDDLKAREPVCDLGQILLHGGKIGGLSSLESALDELGDVQRCGQQTDGEDGNAPVQPEQCRGYQDDLEQDLPEIGLHPKTPVPDGFCLAHELGDVLALGPLLEGNVVPAQDAVEDVPPQGRDAADHVPVAEPLGQVIPAHLQQNKGDQKKGIADGFLHLPRQGMIQHRALEELERHRKDGAHQRAEKCREIAAAVCVFVSFHKYLLLQLSDRRIPFNFSFCRSEGNA